MAPAPCAIGRFERGVAVDETGIGPMRQSVQAVPQVLTRTDDRTTDKRPKCI